MYPATGFFDVVSSIYEALGHHFIFKQVFFDIILINNYKLKILDLGTLGLVLCGYEVFHNF